jgi:L-amino acid N-acyltransferase YncA
MLYEYGSGIQAGTGGGEAMSLKIRQASAEDFDSIWKIFQQIVTKGDTYPYEPDIDKAAANHIWMEVPTSTYVAEDDGEILGTYYLKPNQPGLGSHVCNCGYMVSELARGQGVATQMCQHSQQVAVELGFKAMQFNLVVATNEGAVRLWSKLGYEIIGRLPKAFDHKSLGLVDAVVMYKWLEVESGRAELR